MSPRDVLQAAVDRWPQFDDSHAEDDGSVDGGQRSGAKPMPPQCEQPKPVKRPPRPIHA